MNMCMTENIQYLLKKKQNNNNKNKSIGTIKLQKSQKTIKQEKHKTQTSGG